MIDIKAFVRSALPPSVQVETEGVGLPRLSVRTDLATAQVYFQGAHVTAWQPATSRAPVLWTSRRSLFEPGKAIRGGVPICFPWFGANRADATAPMHGFARLHPWTLVAATADPTGTVRLELELSGEGVAPAWPHRFLATERLTIGTDLRMDLEVRNPGSIPFSYEEALHTYLAVGDVRDVAVTGLEGVEYLDKVEGFSRRRQGDEPLRFSGQTDRVYLGTRGATAIHDAAWSRDITIEKTGSEATVVWNPWIDKARAMADFGDDEWTGMVCVETCNVGSHERTLAPGESHTMTAVISVLDLQR